MKRTVKRAFSYIRFSKLGQALGDSLRRQAEWSAALAARKGWQLDEDLSMQDLGVSGFRGRNAKRGLGAFLEAISQGKVVPGDVLIVESLDRLSREALDDAYQLFRGILKTGVELYTREPERHYTRQSLDDLVGMLEPLLIMSRAHEESQTKSMRGQEYWKSRRAELAKTGQVIHQVAPAWLRLSPDKTQFAVIPEAAAAIRLIYQLAADGFGLNPIAAKLNGDGVPSICVNVRPEKGNRYWSRAYIAKLLKDRSVLGEYQPHVIKDGKRVPHGDPVEGYFPAIISESQFYTVRHAIAGRYTSRGRTGPQVASLFTGLIRDARDGEIMHLSYQHSPAKANARILVSSGARNGKPGSVAMPFPYDPTEQAFLKCVRELRAADIQGGKADDKEAMIAALSAKVDDLSAKIAKVQARIADEAGVDALLTLLEQLDKERKAACADLESLKAEAAHQQPDALGDVQSLARLLHDAQGDPAEQKRLRLKTRARIRQLVAEIWVLVWDVHPTVRAAEVQIWFHTGKVQHLLLAWFRRGRNRGQIGGIGTDLKHPGDDQNPPDLRQYRTDPVTRALFDQAHAKLAETVQAAYEQQEVQARRHWNDARNLRRRRRTATK